jgi:hypothetical protein
VSRCRPDVGASLGNAIDTVTGARFTGRVAPRRYRWLAALIAAAACYALPGAPSLANGPTRTHEHLTAFRIPRQVCGFPVRVKPVVDRGIIKTYPDGHVTITGALKESMTNLRDGHQVTINSSGPVRITTTATGVVVLGHGSGWIAEFGGGNHGFLRQVHGQVVAEGADIRLVHGTSRNICPLIR